MTITCFASGLPLRVFPSSNFFSASILRGIEIQNGNVNE